MGGARAALVILAVCSAAPFARAQNTVPLLRHVLPIDFARIQPFRRAYDVTVLSGDSTIIIGQRDVVLREVLLADSSAGWLLTEARTGSVPSTDSMFLAADLRPVRWTSALGASRLDVNFVADSLRGAIHGPWGASTVSLAAPPDLVLSGAMLELVVGSLPLSEGWADSVSVFSADVTGADVSAAEIAVIGDAPPGPDPASHPAWLVALRSEPRHVFLWVDKATGIAIRTQQILPTHTGTMLEFRARAKAEVIPPR